MIAKEILSAIETNEAEAALDALSDQSKLLPQRHIWLEVEQQEISLDLEDRALEGEWDNAVAHVATRSPLQAVATIDAWLSGKRLPTFHLNGNTRQA